MAADISIDMTSPNQHDVIHVHHRLRPRTNDERRQSYAVFRLMFSLKLTSVCSCLNRSVRQVPNTKTFFENSPSNPQFRSMTIKTTPVDVTDVSDPKREKSTDNTHIERTSAQFRQRVNPGYLNWTHHAGVLPHSDRRSTSRHTLC